ncbi:hypothetical protein BDN67DRAFT_981638 [Paxillus ammoniavirescens]|nr:hypothetical protein BDN67DRAFT_981638 [Paxillus ammoniavirescens]
MGLKFLHTSIISNTPNWVFPDINTYQETINPPLGHPTVTTEHPPNGFHAATQQPNADLTANTSTPHFYIDPSSCLHYSPHFTQTFVTVPSQRSPILQPQWGSQGVMAFQATPTPAMTNRQIPASPTFNDLLALPLLKTPCPKSFVAVPKHTSNVRDGKTSKGGAKVMKSKSTGWGSKSGDGNRQEGGGSDSEVSKLMKQQMEEHTGGGDGDEDHFSGSDEEGKDNVALDGSKWKRNTLKPKFSCKILEQVKASQIYDLIDAVDLISEDEAPPKKQMHKSASLDASDGFTETSTLLREVVGAMSKCQKQQEQLDVAMMEVTETNMKIALWWEQQEQEEYEEHKVAAQWLNLAERWKQALDMSQHPNPVIQKKGEKLAEMLAQEEGL